MGLRRTEKTLSLRVVGIRFRYATVLAMKIFALRFFMLVCIGVILCLPTITGEFAQAQEKERFNLFDNNPNPRIPRERATDADYAKQIQEAFRSEMNFDAQQQKQTLLYFAIFLAMVAITVAGMLYYKMLRQKRVAWELNDPVFLGSELSAAHQLSEQEKRLMREVSKTNSLPSPLKLFVEPKFLLDAWENETFSSSQPEVQRLLSKLFDIRLVS